MRTTITLEPDVAALVKRAMTRHRTSFKRVVNDAIRAGLTGRRDDTPFETPSFRMGKPAVPLTHALRVAAEMEDDEIVRKLDTGK